MLYLNANEEKRMIFEVDIRGVESKELHGYVRFNMYGVEMGFPAEIEHKKITALIPPLLEVIDREIEDGTVIEAKLELFTDRHYFKPWEGEVKVGAPMGIKAKLSGESDNTPRISTRLVTSEHKDEPIEGVSISEEVTKEDIQSMIFDTIKSLTSKKKAVQESGRVRTPRAPKKKPQTKSQWTKERLKNLSEKDIVTYMTRAGTKNKMVQGIILNEARASASEKGKKSNAAVFLEVKRALQKPAK